MGNKVKLVSNAQIYLDTRKLLDLILDITPNFPRQYKYSVGGKMHDIAVELLHRIASAYMIREKETRINHLVLFQADFETLKTLVRIAIEREWFKGGRQTLIVDLMDSIGKQCTAWKNSLIALLKDGSE